MRVLFSTTSFDTIDNGPALFANLVYNNLSKNKEIDLKIITENLLDEKGERDALLKLDLKQTRFNSFFYQFIRIYKYHREAKRIYKNFDFNILVYNNAFTGYLSALFFRIPVVVMINDYEVAFKDKKFRFNKNYFKTNVLHYLEKKAALRAKTVITNSKFMKMNLVKIYHLDESKLKTLIKGIDLSLYNYRIRKQYSKQINILFVKADYRRGRLSNVVAAIKSINDYDIKLTVIGPPEHEMENVKTILNSGGITYELYGVMRPEKVRTYFDSADIFCLPPIKEALGVANMEALACGLPVIATNVGGIPEVLDYGNCGWLISPDNIDELKNAIVECIEDDEKRIQKSNYGYKFVQQFSSNNLIANFTRIIEESV